MKNPYDRGERPELPPPTESGGNPFAPPATKLNTRAILMPGWILMIFALVGMSIPFSFKSGETLLWLEVVLYGSPGVIAVLVIAPGNLAHRKDPKLTLLAVVISIAALVVMALRIARLF